ncbi:hypothetical protein ACLB9X_21995 [Streptomyces sp. 5K101]|uniref:hypothetical protein n=1 Tax=Streptomyces sp. 5K101 TaxID=3390037 RepID=UPI003974E9E2
MADDDDFPEPYSGWLSRLEGWGPSSEERRDALKMKIEAQLVLDRLAAARDDRAAAKLASDSLNRATWVLAAATIVLVVVTVVDIFVD